MLKLYYYINLFPGGGASIHNCCAELEEASNVKVTSEINGLYTLDFDYPYSSDKAKLIKENYEIECEGQEYRIMKLTRENNGSEILHVSCTNLFQAHLKETHVQSFGGTSDTIGAPPSDIIDLAIRKMSWENATRFSDDELSELGMTRADSDGFLIDFEAVDKTTPYDIIQQVISNSGKGEFYIDTSQEGPTRYALVEHIGKDNGIRLDISQNMQNVTIERDITSMVTRLYPYGKDDAHIGSVNNGRQYIDSPNVEYDPSEGKAGYGIKEGYKDYSDYDDPSVILAHAQWEFSPDNEDRIDVPDINITGDFIDIAKLTEYGDIFAVNLGDKVHIIDGENEICERVIRIERYPYEPELTRISIGRIKKDLFFYLNQMGTVTKKYNQISTSNGKVNAAAVSGTLKAAVLSSGSSGAAVFGDELLKITNKSKIKCRIGNTGGSFVFEVYDNQSTPVKSIEVTDSGLKIKAKSIEIGGALLETDESGNLLLNGKTIQTES